VESPGTFGLGAEAAWEGEALKARLRIGGGLESGDSSGLYRIAGMEGSELVTSYDYTGAIQAPPQPGLGLESRGDLVYRNYRESNVLGSSSLHPLEWDAPVVSTLNGPYPAMDSAINTEIAVAEFSLVGEKTWAGFQFPLEDGALASADSLEIPLRLMLSSIPAGFTVRLQTGPLADGEDRFAENPSLIVEKTLYPSGDSVLDASLAGGEWTPLTIKLTNEDRSRLAGADAFRVVIERGGGDAAGRVAAAPVVVRGASLSPVLSANGEIRAAPDQSARSVKAAEVIETYSPTLETAQPDLTNRLHPEGAKQRVLSLTWEGLDAGEGAGADGRFAGIPFENYETFAFFLKPLFPNEAVFSDFSKGTVMVKAGPGGRGSTGPDSADYAVYAEFPLALFKRNQWAKVEIDFRRGKVSIDGAAAAGARVLYRPSASGASSASGAYAAVSAETGDASSYMAIVFSPEAGSALPDGQVLVDEVILENALLSYQANAGLYASWTRRGAIWKIGDFSMIEDFTIETANEAGYRAVDAGGDGASLWTSAWALQNRTRLGVKLLGAALSADFRFKASEGEFSWNGAHSLSRAFGPVTVGGSFFSSEGDGQLEHSLQAAYRGPVTAILGSQAAYRNGETTRIWKAGVEYPGTFGAAIEAEAKWREPGGDLGEKLSNYGLAWLETWGLLLPDLGEGARARDTRGLFRLFYKGTPVGFSLQAEATTGYSLLEGLSGSEAILRAELPFSAGGWQGCFRFERRYRRELDFSGGSIGDDLRNFGESFSDSGTLWLSIPFYSLFDPSLPGAISAESAGTALGRFTDTYTFSLRLPGLRSFWDILIPRSIQASVDRTLNRRLDTLEDYLKVSGSLSFSALNLFGAFGLSPLFSFYKSDEFSHSVEVAVKIPTGNEIEWRLQASGSWGFFGFSGGELRLVNALNFTGEIWSESLSLLWSAPHPKSLLGLLYDWLLSGVKKNGSWPFFESLASREYAKTRTESLEFLFTSLEDRYSLTVTAGHEARIRVLGQLNIAALAKLAAAYDSYTENLSFILTLGASVMVSF
jgi:hypothetical protein